MRYAGGASFTVVNATHARAAGCDQQQPHRGRQAAFAPTPHNNDATIRQATCCESRSSKGRGHPSGDRCMSCRHDSISSVISSVLTLLPAKSYAFESRSSAQQVSNSTLKSLSGRDGLTCTLWLSAPSSQLTEYACTKAQQTDPATACAHDSLAHTARQNRCASDDSGYAPEACHVREHEPPAA